MSDTPVDRSTITGPAASRATKHRSSDVAAAGQWEVGIEWWCAPGVTWPRFTYAQRRTQQEAEDHARFAIAFGDTSASLSAVATSVRALGGTDWREVARRREASSVTDAVTEQLT